MNYILMAGYPEARGWYEIKWDFEYTNTTNTTGESMGAEASALATVLRDKVVSLEAQVEKQAKTIASLEDYKKAHEACFEKQADKFGRLKDEVDRLKSECALLDFKLKDERDLTTRQLKTIERQKQELSKLAAEKIDADKTINAFLSGFEKLEARYGKLREGVAETIERVSARIHVYEGATEPRSAALHDGYSLVHRWLSKVLNDTVAPEAASVNLVGNAGETNCGNCMAATPDA